MTLQKNDKQLSIIKSTALAKIMIFRILDVTTTKRTATTLFVENDTNDNKPMM